MCPVCTVTVVAGLGISRLLGIDDLITSIWIGGFILSFSFITLDWINKKWPRIKISKFKVPFIALFYALTIGFLKVDGSIGIKGNKLWNLDKILLGIIIGTAAFFLGIWADKFERVKFKKIFFPFQKVVFPVLGLIIASLVFYFAI